MQRNKNAGSIISLHLHYVAKKSFEDLILRSSLLNFSSNARNGFVRNEAPRTHGFERQRQPLGGGAR